MRWLVFMGALTLACPARAQNPPTTYNCTQAVHACDQVTVQHTTPLPNMGGLLGAGTVVTPNDFNNPICRVTDSHTTNDHQGGSFLASESGSADVNLFNLDSSYIAFGRKPVNTVLFVEQFSFNGTTCTITPVYASAFPTQGTWTNNSVADVMWSRVNKFLLYTMSGTKLISYNFSSPTNPPATTVYDFANCNGDVIGATGGQLVGIAAGDAVFGVQFNPGGQGQTGINQWVATFTPGLGCRITNIFTAVTAGDWGTSGTWIQPQNSNNAAKVALHNARMSQDGNWIAVAFDTCQSANCGAAAKTEPLLWYVPGVHNYYNAGCTGGGGFPCNGHWNLGYKKFLFESNDVSCANWYSISLADNVSNFATGAVTSLNSVPVGCMAPVIDNHNSWMNVSTTDATPNCTTTFGYIIANGDSWLGGQPYRFAWQHEQVCVDPSGNGKVYRFAHTFNTETSLDFGIDQSIGAMSQDGKYYMFPSDWGGTLGSEANNASCTIGGTQGGTECRGDVFIVLLPTGVSAGSPGTATGLLP